MDHCGPYQAHLLDYLYDALEENEHRAVEEHLAHCPACRTALDQARGQRQLLAAAARMEFPAVRFTPPPDVVPLRRPPVVRRPRAWGRWAAAAVLLLSLGGLGGLGGWSWFDYGRAHKVQDDYLAHAEKAQKEVARAENELRQARQQRDERIKDLKKAALEQQVHVTVTGPPVVQPGAPNQYQIRTRDFNNRPVMAHLTLRVVDQARQRVLEEQKDVLSAGDYVLGLPADLDLKPTSRLSLQVLARREGGAEEAVRTDLPLDPPLYTTYLSTDRPLYRPGDTIFFRSLTLDRFSLKPPDEDLHLVFRLRKPDGSSVDLGQHLSRVVRVVNGQPQYVMGPDGQPLRGIGAGEYTLEPNAPGGEWALIVSEADHRFPDQERRFLVNRYEQQNLNKELEWSQRSYGPGDEVVANCKVETADLRKVRCAVEARVRIDERWLVAPNQPMKLETDTDGRVVVRFRLPKEISRGDGTLSVEFHHGGDVETLSKPIPIVLNRLNVAFYPEGGDLVAGVNNRVYFQVHTTLDKPAELRGRIVDNTGRVVKDGVETFHVADQPGANQGMGVFELTPEAGKTYELKIDTPAGLEGKHELPRVKADGVALSIPDGVTKPGEPIRVVLRNAGPERSLLVGAYCRGRLMDHQPVTVKAGATATVDLRPAQEVGGVYRVTVFEEPRGGGKREAPRPLAERLVYREPAQTLRLAAQPDRAQYVPGDHPRVALSAFNEKDQPVGAIALVSVVDRRVLALADEKTAADLPTHFYLMTEVRRPQDLEHADFLLSPHPKARVALDLLLGTQGWRRFVESDPGYRNTNPGERADVQRLLVSSGNARPKEVDLLRRDVDKVRQDYQREALRLDAGLSRALGAREKTKAALETDVFREAAAKVGRYDRLLARLRTDVVPWVGAAFLLAAFVCLAVGILRNSLRAVPLGGLALAASALVVGILVVQVREQPQLQPDTGGAVAVQAEHAPPGRDVAPAPDAPRPQFKPLATRPQKEDQPLAVQNREDLPKLAAPPADLERWLVEEKQDRRRLDAEEKRTLERLNAVGADVPAVPPPFVVREYAHQHERPAPGEARSDFAETLYWNPVVVLPEGRAEASFALGDAVTSYQVTVLGHTLDGRLGSATATVEARLPLVVSPKVPVEVGSADKIDVPVSVTNNTGMDRTVDLRVAATGLTLREGDSDRDRVLVSRGDGGRRVFHFRPTIVEGPASLEVRGDARPSDSDSVRRTFSVVPDGFPIVVSRSDLLEKSASHEVVLPATWLPGTLRLQAEVYPSTLADLQKGLEALLREPGGCFEQTSSSNYPNLLILNYLKSTDQVRPEMQARAVAMLDRGYRQLAGFECPYDGSGRHGFEWFGAPNAAHEALTAYGLLEFGDMAKVYPVDPALVARTRQFLLDQRDGRGGFKRNPRALDTFGRAPQDVTNAYIVWSLTETGKDDDLTKELDALAAAAKQSKDPYFLALVANSLLNRGRSAEGVALLRATAGQQQADGHLDAEKTSITGSHGRPLQVETTALAVLGWLKANRPGDFNGPVRKAVEWLGRQRGGFGGYGATQSTVLALKALIAYAGSHQRTTEAGELRLLVGDAVVERARIEAGAQDAITVRLPEPEKHLHAGKNAVRVEVTGERNVFPYTLSWSYQTLTPPSAADAPVRLLTRLDRQAAEEGGTVRLTVTVENARAEGQGMAVAVVGLPAGLTLPEDLKQLREYAALRNNGTERGPIDFFETRGRELVLYWRDLAPHRKVEVPIDLVCRVPGEYRGPASRSYLYYDSDVKCWVEPLQISIKAKE